jgi:ubiquinone/menaquinone biosynthesis C-methylase UbiE
MQCNQVDQALGFHVNHIEDSLMRQAILVTPEGNLESWGQGLHQAQSWVGLHPQTLLTPYQELVWMCESMQQAEKAHVVDLGAGYGRLGLVMRQRLPEASYTGVEIVKERVDEGNRIFQKHGCQRARLIEQDLSLESYQLPLGDCYFIYDYGRIDHLRWTMAQLQNLADIHRFQVVARGQGIRSLIEMAHPWLHCLESNPYRQYFEIYSTHLTYS